MAKYAIDRKIYLEERVCIVCGIDFGVPEQLLNEHRRVGGFHYCPNGHSQGWENGTYQEKMNVLKRELAAEKERLQRALARENEARARADALVSEAKRVAKRAKAGVCPCCHRTFQQLARHMQSKHSAHHGRKGAD